MSTGGQSSSETTSLPQTGFVVVLVRFRPAGGFAIFSSSLRVLSANVLSTVTAS